MCPAAGFGEKPAQMSAPQARRGASARSVVAEGAVRSATFVGSARAPRAPRFRLRPTPMAQINPPKTYSSTSTRRHELREDGLQTAVVEGEAFFEGAPDGRHLGGRGGRRARRGRPRLPGLPGQPLGRGAAAPRRHPDRVPGPATTRRRSTARTAPRACSRSPTTTARRRRASRRRSWPPTRSSSSARRTRRTPCSRSTTARASSRRPHSRAARPSPRRRVTTRPRPTSTSRRQRPTPRRQPPRGTSSTPPAPTPPPARPTRARAALQTILDDYADTAEAQTAQVEIGMATAGGHSQGLGDGPHPARPAARLDGDAGCGRRSPSRPA